MKPITPQQLEQQTDSLTSLLNNLPVGIFAFNPSGMITLCSGGLERELGYPTDTLRGRHVDILFETNSADWQALLDEIAAKPSPLKASLATQVRFRQQNGNTIEADLLINPVSTEYGQSYIGVVLKQPINTTGTDNFRRIFDSAPFGMLMIDQQGTIQLANRRLCDLFGYQPQELIQQSMNMLLPERYRQGHNQLLALFLNDPKTRPMGPGRDLTGRHKDGSELPVEIGLSLVQGANGANIVAAINDISERKRMENNLRNLNADLDEFTYVASHDLKSPLRGIQNLVDWLKEDIGETNNPDIANNLERIQIRIERMENLIEDLLKYARSSKQDGNFTIVNIRDLLEKIIDLLNIPGGFSIELDCKIDTITTTPAPLETVLRNLIDNAIKHHDRDRGTIHIRAEADNSFCIFTVSDNGPGIPKTSQDRIFKLFQTLDNNNTGRSGIGLAVTKRLVETHNGSIEIKSNDGQRGSSFRFSWPRFARRDING